MGNLWGFIRSLVVFSHGVHSANTGYEAGSLIDAQKWVCVGTSAMRINQLNSVVYLSHKASFGVVVHSLVETAGKIFSLSDISTRLNTAGARNTTSAQFGMGILRIG